jgi:hypothetical protein
MKLWVDFLRVTRHAFRVTILSACPPVRLSACPPVRPSARPPVSSQQPQSPHSHIQHPASSICRQPSNILELVNVARYTSRTCPLGRSSTSQQSAAPIPTLTHPASSICRQPSNILELVNVTRFASRFCPPVRLSACPPVRPSTCPPVRSSTSQQTQFPHSHIEHPVSSICRQPSNILELVNVTRFASRIF